MLSYLLEIGSWTGINDSGGGESVTRGTPIFSLDFYGAMWWDVRSDLIKNVSYEICKWPINYILAVMCYSTGIGEIEAKARDVLEIRIELQIGGTSYLKRAPGLPISRHFKEMEGEGFSDL